MSPCASCTVETVKYQNPSGDVQTLTPTAFSLTGALDDMSTRIDDLEKNISDLMTQAGVEEFDGENKFGDASGTA